MCGVRMLYQYNKKDIIIKILWTTGGTRGPPATCMCSCVPSVPFLVVPSTKYCPDSTDVRVQVPKQLLC